MANTNDSSSDSDFFKLAPEMRNVVYELAFENAKATLQGDNREAVLNADYHEIDWKSLETSVIPSICDVNKQIRSETLGMLGPLYADFLPAFTVGSDKYEWRQFKEWLRVSEERILPRLRWFLLDTGNAKIVFFLQGTEGEFGIITREEVHEESSKGDLGVAITHFKGYAVDEDNVPAVVENGVGEILSELEDAVDFSSRRLTAEGLEGLVKSCIEMFREEDDDSDYDMERDEEPDYDVENDDENDHDPENEDEDEYGE